MWVRVRSEGEGESESESADESENEGENKGNTDLLPHRHILIHILTCPSPAQEYYHSTQDEIVHGAQPTIQPAQFHERL